MSETEDQIAAAPLRLGKSGKVEVLLITSRDTGRWVLPKGWTMAGCKPWRAAEIEALEEAGARGEIVSDKLGVYCYDKIMGPDEIIRCKVKVFPLIVETLDDDWKERKERTRRWFSHKAAARAVDEPDLAELLLDLPNSAPAKALAGREKHGAG